MLHHLLLTTIIFLIFDGAIGCNQTQNPNAPEFVPCDRSPKIFFYDTTAVDIIDSPWGLKKPKICEICIAGREVYFAAANSSIPNQTLKGAIGTLRHTKCGLVIICNTDYMCYFYRSSPTVILYPYCDPSSGCFVTAFFSTAGTLASISPDPPQPVYSYAKQRDAAGNIKPVTDQDAYMRILSIRCAYSSEGHKCAD